MTAFKQTFNDNVGTVPKMLDLARQMGFVWYLMITDTIKRFYNWACWNIFESKSVLIDRYK